MRTHHVTSTPVRPQRGVSAEVLAATGILQPMLEATCLMAMLQLPRLCHCRKEWQLHDGLSWLRSSQAGVSGRLAWLTPIIFVVFVNLP